MAKAAKKTKRAKAAVRKTAAKKPAAKKTAKAAAKKAPAKKKKTLRDKRTLDALRDTLDFRDRMFEPTLVEVPAQSDMGAYRALNVPVLDQGQEGACTGYGLATAANYLMRKLWTYGFSNWVSPRMLYVMAKRYDEWPGQEYDGSSARGAMKGWHKHGVCTNAEWPDTKPKSSALTLQRAEQALECLLGAYLRVNHKDLVAMHAAISEVGVLFASADVHAGWDTVGSDGVIEFHEEVDGGHAFAIVGYDREGFWIQNSWGHSWGDRGLARISYDDWLRNGNDVWVARLGVPVKLTQPRAAAAMRSGATLSTEGYVYADLRNHIVTLDNDGVLRGKGTYGLTKASLEAMVTKDIPDKMSAWPTKRLVVYAHGGLVPENYAVQYVANNRQAALDSQIFPLSIIWRSDALQTIENIIKEAFGRRRAAGAMEELKDFMLDRMDDTMEPIARLLGGKSLWDEMKENATLASAKGGGAALIADHIKTAVRANGIDEVHLVGHSAGAILLAPFAQVLAKLGVKISSLTLWAPACTTALFRQTYAPLIKSGAIASFNLYTLSDAVEQDDDCAKIYHKSLLYLVSNAFEKRIHIPLISKGEPLLGLAKDVEEDDAIAPLLKAPQHRWVVAPDRRLSDARHHGDFDNDRKTLASTYARITGGHGPKAVEVVSLKPRPQRVEQIARAVAAARAV